MRPMFSAKFPMCLTLLLADLVLPSAAARMDHETELKGTKISLPGKGRQCLPQLQKDKGGAADELLCKRLGV